MDDEEDEGRGSVLAVLLEGVEGDEKGRGDCATSARRWEALFRDIFSAPRSSRKERIIAFMSAGDRSGEEQNVHGPIPSFTQMIFPQFKQLGAAARSGCRVARQGQRRAEAGVEAERAGSVCISRARIAESCHGERH